MKEALDTRYEITKLVKKSPKRDAKLQQIKEQLQHETSESSPGIRLLCPTRRTVRASAIHSIVENYPVLKELWTWSLDNCSDTEMKARIRGVDYHMMKFYFVYGLGLDECILRHADSLSTTLQRPNLSAAEAQSIASMTVNTFSNLRSENNSDLFWADVMNKAEERETLKNLHCQDAATLSFKRVWLETGEFLPVIRYNDISVQCFI